MIFSPDATARCGPFSEDENSMGRNVPSTLLNTWRRIDESKETLLVKGDASTNIDQLIS